MANGNGNGSDAGDIDLMGWDTVFALRIEALNASIEAQNTTPAKFDGTDTVGGAHVEGDWNAWSVTGGEGNGIIMECPIKSGTLTTPGLDPVALDGGVVETRRDGDYRRFYPADQFSEFEQAALGYLRRPTARGMVIELLRNPDATGSDLAEALDVLAAHDGTELVGEMKQDIEDALNVQAMDTSREFFEMMAANALSRKPPVSFLGRFQLERRGEHRGTFDIRERGVLPVVDAVRVLALEQRYLDTTNTFDRLRAVSRSVPELSDVLEETLNAYRFLVDFRLEDQLTAFENGEKLDNQIEPQSLRKAQQSLLRNMFSTVAGLQEVVAERYNLGRRS